MKHKEKKLLHDLHERVKELNCLYGFSKIIEKRDYPLEKILREAVKLFPPSWQYPEVTCARISINDNEYKTSNFKPSPWSQEAPIKSLGIKVGFVQVCYLKKMAKSYEGPFLKEERFLLNAMAERLGKVLEHKTLEQDLKDTNALLEKQKKSLEEKNLVLREVIAQVEVEKNNIKHNVIANLNQSVLPILERMRDQKDTLKYVNLVIYHLKELTSSFGVKMTGGNFRLTPREIEICNLIKGDLSTKQISNLLHLSTQTIDRHRKNIRYKLKLSRRDNLTSYLKQL